jgi:thiol-disulfide isomerase/thioredoxin
MNLFERFAVAHPYGDFLTRYGSEAHQNRWHATRDQVKLSDSQVKLLKSFVREMPVLVLAGAWCGDCASQCPIFEKFAEIAPVFKIKYLDRDEHADVQKLLQINGGNRVPVAVFFSEDGHEVSRFGDRTLSKYRSLIESQTGEACSTGITIGGDPLFDQTVQDWLEEFERAQYILRLSPRLRQKHRD